MYMHVPHVVSLPPSLPLSLSPSLCLVVQEFFCAYLEDSPCLKAQELLVMHHLSHHRYADAITMQDKIRPLAMVHVIMRSCTCTCIYRHQRMPNQLSCLGGSCTMYTPLSRTMYTPLSRTMYTPLLCTMYTPSHVPCTCIPPSHVPCIPPLAYHVYPPLVYHVYPQADPDPCVRERSEFRESLLDGFSRCVPNVLKDIAQSSTTRPALTNQKTATRGQSVLYTT